MFIYHSDIFFLLLLPPAYVVRREGNSFTLFVCPHRGGEGGYPGPVPPPGGGVPRSGTPPGGGGTWVRYPPPGGGGTQVRYTPPGGGTQVWSPRGGTQVRYPPGGGGWYPGQVPPPGGTQVQYPPPRGVPRSGTPPGGGGYPGQVTPPGGGGGTRVRYPPPPRGGYPVGQQKEYSLHGGRYASCVHAGGLSCFYHYNYFDFNLNYFSKDDDRWIYIELY